MSTKDFTVDPDGTVHLVVSREAPTLVLFRWDRTAEWAHVEPAGAGPQRRLTRRPGLTDEDSG